MGSRIRAISLALLTTLIATAAAAPDSQSLVSPSWYQDLHWRFIGPFRGGRVLTVAGVPGDSRHFWFGAVDGGVWATTDSGRTWSPIFDTQHDGSIGAVAVVPSDPNTIYVGTGEADMRSDIAHGNGVYKTIDGGARWSFLGLADTRQVGRILVNPKNPNIVFVAALGHAYGPNNERGVFRSKDGGAHWQRVLFKDENTGAIDLAFKPGDPNTVFAALWQTRRPPWSVYPPSNGPGSGLYVSHDAGSHWTQIVGNGFIAYPGRIGIGVSRAKPSRVYALSDGPSAEAGLYVSEDSGVHWSKVNGDKRIWNRGWYFSGITVDPNNADRVYVMDTVVLRSDDGGKHFIALKGDPTGDDFHDMWIDPTNSARQIIGSDQGTIVTLNGGKTWSSWYNQPTAQIYHVSTDNRFPYWVYGAQQDSGAVALPSRATGYDGITMEQFHEVTAGGESDMIAPDPDDPDLVYGGRVDKLDLRTGQTRHVDPTLLLPDGEHRTAWTLPLAWSRVGKDTLYFGDQRLYRTSDGGIHWELMSPDLTRADAGAPPNLDPSTAADDDHFGRARGVIYSIAPSPFHEGTLWAGTDDGLAWTTLDNGAHWTNITPAGLTPWSKIAGIELSHFDTNTAYLAVDRHRLDDDAPYLYRTGDGGQSWQRIDHGLPGNAFVNVVREDPARKGLLYAGTERGMFVSFDDGGHWQSLQQNLPMASVRDIEVHGDDLVIATHGRGFWIMDNVTALRQMDAAPSALAAGAMLFKPADAIRLRPTGFTGTPMPKDEPMAANPPDGAAIDYVLPADGKGPVMLTIYNAEGKKVASFSSSDKPATPDAAKLTYAPEWAPPKPSLSAEPGMHRFVWDLRYGTPANPDDESDPKGVWVPPGVYMVELRANGKAVRQQLTLEPDPRVKVEPAALVREFELAVQVQEKAKQAAAAVKDATALLKALDARQAQDTRLRPRIRDLMDKVSEFSGIPVPGSVRADRTTAPPPPASLKNLSDELGKLQDAVDGADADPSPDARAAFATLSRSLDSKLQQWQQMKLSNLARFDTGMKRQQ
ncbi:MAG TPA: hypothetical protein VHU18_05375 [Rhizomicrobium sp.]|jgi:photosystem II stability/assembly factor-like uncharacterized protein|nr:hypothetical protein [Rhizomicrobium sp.]